VGMFSSTSDVAMKCDERVSDDQKCTVKSPAILMLASASQVAALIRGRTAQDSIDIHVVKDPQCGCCNACLEILNKEGFNVTTEDRNGQRLTGSKIENGIPENMMSCHTAKVGKYSH